MQDGQACTGWAVGYAARSYYAATVEKRNIRDPNNIPSPSYIYNAIRDPRKCEGGAFLADAANLLKSGSLSAEDFPLHSGCRLPTQVERESASDFKIKGWSTINPANIDDIKGQLAYGHPVIIGADVGDSFTNLAGKSIYKGDSSVVGQHAFTLVGYDDAKQAFRLINSWGTLWADGGFGWIDYGAFKRMAREAYVLDMLMSGPVADETVAEVEKPQPIKPSPRPPRAPEQEAEVQPVIDRPVEMSDCAYVYSDVVGGRKLLKGFVGSEQDLIALKTQWGGYAEEFAVELRPWPQCEVLLTLASAVSVKDGPSLKAKDGKQRFVEGDPVVLELLSPPKPSYVYAVYVQADGSVLTLMQPDSDLSPLRSSNKVVFGDGGGGGPSFTASKPFGNEMILAVASASPLFEHPLPKAQTEREFLSSLRRAILYKSDKTKGDRRISAAFLGITTEKKK